MLLPSVTNKLFKDINQAVERIQTKECAAHGNICVQLVPAKTVSFAEKGTEFHYDSAEGVIQEKRGSSWSARPIEENSN